MAGSEYFTRRNFRSSSKKILDDGKARYIGVSNLNAHQIEELCEYIDIVSTQNYYNMLVRNVEKELFPIIKKNSI